MREENGFQTPGATPTDRGSAAKHPMPTIQDVARRAGVSVATVSRVLNGTVRVNPELAQRVHAAIEALQYRPSHAARSLRARRSVIIGLLISDLQNPFFTELVRGVEDVAQRNGYSLILCNSDEDAQKIETVGQAVDYVTSHA